MEKPDIIDEAVPIIERTMRALLAAVPTTQGRAGADVRRAVGDLLAHAEQLLHDDAAGVPTALCYETARLAGVTMVKFFGVLNTTAAETPTTLGGILTKYCLIMFGLSTVSRVISDMTFESRQDVDKVRSTTNAMFFAVEEAAADDMDSASYRALVTLHAAVSFYLVETERPLPRMLRFQFARPLTTLVAAHRLYDDASRCDELRVENKVVHPAFMKQDGVALSA